MKLIGSLMEVQFREELQNSWLSLKQGRSNYIMRMLQGKMGKINKAFILNWVPEQGEVFYLILVNGCDVVGIEIEKESDSILEFEVTSVLDYKKTLRSRREKVQLAVALDLSK